MSPSELQHFIHERIPLTKAMGIWVRVYSAKQVILWAPLEANRNHLDTAFGVSLGALGTVSAWAWLMAVCDDADLPCSIVIQGNRMRYLRPVNEDFVAVTHAPVADTSERFLSELRDKGKATLRIKSVMHEEHSPEHIAAIFDGTFVAMHTGKPRETQSINPA